MLPLSGGAFKDGEQLSAASVPFVLWSKGTERVASATCEWPSLKVPAVLAVPIMMARFRAREPVCVSEWLKDADSSSGAAVLRAARVEHSSVSFGRADAAVTVGSTTIAARAKATRIVQGPRAGPERLVSFYSGSGTLSPRLWFQRVRTKEKAVEDGKGQGLAGPGDAIACRTRCVYGWSAMVADGVERGTNTT